MKRTIHTRTVFQLSVNDDDDLIFETLYDDCEVYCGDVALADIFGGDDDSGEVNYTDEEIAILQNQLSNMEGASEIFWGSQLPIDLLSMNYALQNMPAIQEYVTAQLGSATNTLHLSDALNTSMAAAAQANIDNQQAQIATDTQQTLGMYNAANDIMGLGIGYAQDLYNSSSEMASDLYDTNMAYGENLYNTSMGYANDTYATGMGMATDLYGAGMQASADTAATAAGLYDNYSDLNSQFLQKLSEYDANANALRKEKLDMLSADYNGVMGLANADVTQAYKTAKDSLEREQARYGYNPSSGVTNEQDRLYSMSQAKDTALARQQARFAESDRVETGNLERAKLNWDKDLNLLQADSANNATLGQYATNTLNAAGSTLANANDTLVNSGAAAGSILGQTGSAVSNYLSNAAQASNFFNNAGDAATIQNQAASGVSSLLNSASNAGSLVSSAPITATDYTNMLNGNWGTYTGQANYQLPASTDYGNLMMGLGNTASNNNLGTQPTSSGSAWPALIGGASTLGAAWLLS